jgi:hypothetical protein
VGQQKDQIDLKQPLAIMPYGDVKIWLLRGVLAGSPSYRAMMLA